jgi:hypothetical protein
MDENMQPVEEKRGREILVRLTKLLACGKQPTVRELGLTEAEARWMQNNRLISMPGQSSWGASTGPYEDKTRVVGIPAEALIDLIDSDSETSQTPAVTQNVYNLSGPSSRVNIGSTDQSLNSISISETQLFSKLREAVEAQIPDPSTKARILEEIGKGEGMQKKSPMFNNWFTRFLALTADCITVVQPFIPALAQLLSRQAC